MARKLRIIHIIRSLDLGCLGGGAELFATSLSQCLLNDFEQIFAVIRRTDSLVEQRWINDLEKFNIKTFFLQDNDQLKPAMGLRRLIQLTKNWKPDILHTHYQVGALYATIIRIFSKTPKILRTIHNSQEWGFGPLPQLLRIFLSTGIFPIVFDGQVGVSQEIAYKASNSWGAKLARRPTIYIPNALRKEWLDRCSPSLWMAIRQTSHQPIIGTVGRLTAQKGYNNLITAFTRVLDTIPSAQLWIVGDGDLRVALELQAEQLKIQKRIVFWGQCEDVPEILRRMDLFISTSLYEGLPTVILESMACGVPVIATKIPGNSELIIDGQTGWLTPKHNPEMLAKKICHALQMPSERQRIRLNAARQLDKFSITSIAVQYKKIYLQLLND